jgi:hypothetical protein
MRINDNKDLNQSFTCNSLLVKFIQSIVTHQLRTLDQLSDHDFMKREILPNNEPRIQDISDNSQSISSDSNLSKSLLKSLNQSKPLESFD